MYEAGRPKCFNRMSNIGQFEFVTDVIIHAEASAVYSP